ncbi:MAG: DsbA family protein [Scytonematopsis contorta HA4267-MV1]|jgi:protein-disulfide isomerase|nr:DsbA family protein [Scytonematopsis contorta HA4267-MV1]
MRKFFSSIFCLILCLFCIFISNTNTALAVSKIDSKLEEQVLQILREHPEVIIDSVQIYQQKQQQKADKVRQAFLQDLNTNPQIIIGNSPTTGTTESKTVLLEFSDFQCPYCAQAHKTLKKFIAKHKNEVVLVYKHFPLSEIHSQAIPAATAAWSAQQQGKFWEYQDALFDNQKKLGEDLYLDVAKKLNLDLDKFANDRAIAYPEVQKDRQLAENLGLTGTPFFIFNGKTLSGAVKISDFENLLAQNS